MPKPPTLQRPWMLLLTTLVTMLVCAATLALGFWQLRRAEQKEALWQTLKRQSALAAISNVEISKSLAQEPTGQALIARRAHLQGVWLAEHTVYLDNRQMNAKPGFFVLTPLRLQTQSQPVAAHAPIVMVQRGWIPRDFVQRDRLQPIQTPSGLVKVVGLIEPPPSKLMDFDQAEQHSSIRQNIDLAQFKAQTGLGLLTSVSVRQVDSASEGLLREWPAPNLNTSKHLGYAFQWFALCALTLFLYVWFQWISPYVKRQRVQRQNS